MANVIQFIVKGKDLSGGVFKTVDKGFMRMQKGVAGVTNQLFSLKGLVAGAGVGLLAKSFIDAADTTEKLGIRLNVMLGSAKEGNKVFQDMTKFASQVPFEYEEIMSSATMLAGILKGGSDEIQQWMPLIGDLAATTGLTIQETTEQVQRMLSGGAAAADKFRERGVLAMLGFQAGVSVSAADTKQKLLDAWQDPLSKFRGATSQLAATWTGTMSMISDKWFAIRNTIMDAGLMDFIKSIASIIDKQLGGALDEVKKDAKGWADYIIEGVVSIALGSARLIDAIAGPMNTIRNIANDLWEGFNSLPTWVKEVGVAGAIIGGKKGLLVIAGVSKVAADFKTTGTWWDAYSSGKIGFFEWFTSGHDKAQARLEQLKNQVAKGVVIRDDDGGSALAKSVFGTTTSADPSSLEGRMAAFFKDVQNKMAVYRKARKDAEGVGGEGFKDTRTEPQKQIDALTVESSKYEQQLGALEQYLNTRMAKLNESNMTEQEVMMAKYEADQLAIDEAFTRELITEEQRNEQRRALKMNHLAQMQGLEGDFLLQGQAFAKAVQKGEVLNALGHGSKMFGIAATQFKAIFKIRKALSLAKAVATLPSAVIQSYENAGGYPWGIVPAGLMAAAGAAQIAQIKGSSFGGQAHSGLTNVPREGTFLLNKGERVIQPEQNRDLTNFLANTAGGGLSIENLNITVEGRDLIDMDDSELQQLLADRFIPALDALSQQGIRQTDFTTMEQL